MRTRQCDSSPDAIAQQKNSLRTKHVVAAGLFARDAGSTPAASTSLNGVRKQLRGHFDFMKSAKGIGIILAFSLFSASLAVGAAGPGWFNVRDYGAKGDGKTKDTVALQKALDTCAAAGGGTVRLPEGAYLTGSLVLGANTTLRFEPRANLVGSPDIEDYPLVRVRWEGEFRQGHRALISAEKAGNVSIEGPGAIFGPPLTVSRLRDPRGPVLIELTDCTNAVLEGFSTQYQQLWSIHLLFCRNFTARNLIIRTLNCQRRRH